MTGILDFDWRGASGEEFAAWLFDRPVANSRMKRFEWDYGGEFEPFIDHPAFIETCTRLFEGFGTASSSYSVGQIDQGLWLLLTHPYSWPSSIADETVPQESSFRCVRACYHLYADFLAVRQPEEQVGALHMWWDQYWPGATAPFLNVVLETNERILGLPDKQSRHAALHGLGHLKADFPDERIHRVIDPWLARERKSLSAEDLAYVEYCRNHPVA